MEEESVSGQPACRSFQSEVYHLDLTILPVCFLRSGLTDRHSTHCKHHFPPMRQPSLVPHEGQQLAFHHRPPANSSCVATVISITVLLFISVTSRAGIAPGNDSPGLVLILGNNHQAFIVKVDICNGSGMPCPGIVY